MWFHVKDNSLLTGGKQESVYQNLLAAWPHAEIQVTDDRKYMERCVKTDAPFIPKYDSLHSPVLPSSLASQLCFLCSPDTWKQSLCFRNMSSYCTFGFHYALRLAHLCLKIKDFPFLKVSSICLTKKDTHHKFAWFFFGNTHVFLI